MSTATTKGALVVDGMSGQDLLRHLQEHRPTLYYQLINDLPSAKYARSGSPRLSSANSARGPPRLFTRAEALAILKIGETLLAATDGKAPAHPHRKPGSVQSC